MQEPRQPTHSQAGYELISETDCLQTFPEFRSHCPDYRTDNIREFIFRSDMRLEFVGSGLDATEVRR